LGEDQTLGVVNGSFVACAGLADRLDSGLYSSYDSLTMTAATIEQRIEALEEEVRQLRAAVKKPDGEQPWWERFGGMFKDDPVFDEIVDAGQTYRESLRPRAK
jgi:hypothetical protein